MVIPGKHASLLNSLIVLVCAVLVSMIIIVPTALAIRLASGQWMPLGDELPLGAAIVGAGVGFVIMLGTGALNRFVAMPGMLGQLLEVTEETITHTRWWGKTTVIPMSALMRWTLRRGGVVLEGHEQTITLSGWFDRTPRWLNQELAARLPAMGAPPPRKQRGWEGRSYGQMVVMAMSVFLFFAPFLGDWFVAAQTAPLEAQTERLDALSEQMRTVIDSTVPEERATALETLIPMMVEMRTLADTPQYRQDELMFRMLLRSSWEEAGNPGKAEEAAEGIRAYCDAEGVMQCPA